MTIQSILFDKNKYSYIECIRWLFFHGYLTYKHYTMTHNCMKFKFKEPDETMYDYKLEKKEEGIWYIIEYPKVSLDK